MGFTVSVTSESEGGQLPGTEHDASVFLGYHVRDAELRELESSE